MSQPDILTFRLPHYAEVPSMGLYLEQTVKYINQCLTPLDEEFKVTTAMISNYVKMKIIANPSSKTYDRDQIIYLLYLTLMKNVLPLNDLDTMFRIQRTEYPIAVAYDYFCDELTNALHYVFTNQNQLPTIGGALTPAKLLLKNAILAIVHKIYVKHQLPLLAESLR